MIGRVFSLWLIMMMVVALWFVWAAMRAQWIVVIAVLRSGGWARPLPPHFDEWARLVDPIIISLLCEELYCVSVIGRVRDEE